MLCYAVLVISPDLERVTFRMEKRSFDFLREVRVHGNLLTATEVVPLSADPKEVKERLLDALREALLADLDWTRAVLGVVEDTLETVTEDLI